MIALLVAWFVLDVLLALAYARFMNAVDPIPAGGDNGH